MGRNARQCILRPGYLPGLLYLIKNKFVSIQIDTIFVLLIKTSNMNNMEKFATLKIKELNVKYWYNKVSIFALKSNPTYISTEIKYKLYRRISPVPELIYEICLQWEGGLCKIWSSEDYEECFKSMVEYINSNL